MVAACLASTAPCAPVNSTGVAGIALVIRSRGPASSTANAAAVCDYGIEDAVATVLTDRTAGADRDRIVKLKRIR